MKKFLKGFVYAINGIINTIKTELNMKIHIFMMILVIICGYIFKISKMEWIICVILFSLVIGFEIINTAIENIVDMISPEKNDKAKIIKDAGAGAVLVVAIGAAIIGLLIFIPKII